MAIDKRQPADSVVGQAIIVGLLLNRPRAGRSGHLWVDVVCEALGRAPVRLQAQQVGPSAGVASAADMAAANAAVQALKAPLENPKFESGWPVSARLPCPPPL